MTRADLIGEWCTALHKATGFAMQSSYVAAVLQAASYEYTHRCIAIEGVVRGGPVSSTGPNEAPAQQGGPRDLGPGKGERTCNGTAGWPADGRCPDLLSAPVPSPRKPKIGDYVTAKDGSNGGYVKKILDGMFQGQRLNHLKLTDYIVLPMDDFMFAEPPAPALKGSTVRPEVGQYVRHPERGLGVVVDVYPEGAVLNHAGYCRFEDLVDLTPVDLNMIRMAHGWPPAPAPKVFDYVRNKNEEVPDPAGTSDCRDWSRAQCKEYFRCFSEKHGLPPDFFERHPAEPPGPVLKVGDYVREKHGYRVGRIVRMTESFVTVQSPHPQLSHLIPSGDLVVIPDPDIVYRYFGNSVFCNRNKCQAGTTCEVCREMTAGGLPPMQEQGRGT